MVAVRQVGIPVDPPNELSLRGVWNVALAFLGVLPAGVLLGIIPDVAYSLARAFFGVTCAVLHTNSQYYLRNQLIEHGRNDDNDRPVAHLFFSGWK